MSKYSILVVSALRNLLHKCARSAPGFIVSCLVHFGLHLCVIEHNIFAGRENMRMRPLRSTVSPYARTRKLTLC